MDNTGNGNNVELGMTTSFWNSLKGIIFKFFNSLNINLFLGSPKSATSATPIVGDEPNNVSTSSTDTAFEGESSSSSTDTFEAASNIDRKNPDSSSSTEIALEPASNLERKYEALKNKLRKMAKESKKKDDIIEGLKQKYGHKDDTSV